MWLGGYVWESVAVEWIGSGEKNLGGGPGGLRAWGGRLAGRGSGPGSLAQNTACNEFDRGLFLGSVSVSLPPHAHDSTQPMVTWLTTGHAING